jgi:hypothetical protein
MMDLVTAKKNHALSSTQEPKRYNKTFSNFADNKLERLEQQRFDFFLLILQDFCHKNHS